MISIHPWPYPGNIFYKKVFYFYFLTVLERKQCVGGCNEWKNKKTDENLGPSQNLCLCLRDDLEKQFEPREMQLS